MERLRSYIALFVVLFSLLYFLIVWGGRSNSAFYTRSSDLRKFVAGVATTSECVVTSGACRGSGNPILLVDSDSHAEFRVSGPPSAVVKLVQDLKTAFEGDATATGAAIATQSATRVDEAGLNDFVLTFTSRGTRGTVKATLADPKPGNQPNTATYLLKVSMDERGW